MDEKQISQQLDAQKKTTEKALQSKESATEYLIKLGLIAEDISSNSETTVQECDATDADKSTERS